MVTSVGSPASATTATTGNRAGIADNFDSFLLLLTTQLRNQNPLDPLDTNQFTQQLVQFAGVEQQIKTNDTLSALLSLNDSTRLSNAAAFIGKNVVADGDTSLLQYGQAAWHIHVDSAAPNTNVVVKDAEGNQVYAREISLAAGSQAFVWNGVTSSGQPAPDGFYTIQVTARDAAGSSVVAQTDFQGTVDGVELKDGEPVLRIGNLTVKLSAIKTIVAPPAGETPGGEDGESGES